MADERQSATPLRHVSAELAAAPIAALSGFDSCLVEIDPDFDQGNSLANSTVSIWREVESDMLSRFPSVSFDELIRMRDSIWFDSQHYRPRSLINLYSVLAESALDDQGAIAVPRLLRDGGQMVFENVPDSKASRLSWGWLTRSIPSDFLISFLENVNCVDAISPALARSLNDYGYCETHMHVGAGADFELLWISCLNGLLLDDIRYDAFESPGAVWGNGIGLGVWLLRAAIVRQFLMEFLVFREKTQDLDSYLRFSYTKEIGSRRARIAQFNPWDVRELIRSCLRPTHARIPSQRTFDELKNMFGRLIGRRTPYQQAEDIPIERFRDHFLNLDPIAYLIRQSSFNDMPSPEISFCRSARWYLCKATNQPKHSQSNDRLFRQLFWQIQRIRCALYRYIIQRPGIPGLQYFQRHYNRLRPTRGTLLKGSSLLKSAAITDGIGKGLKALEVRTSPESSRPLMLDFITEFGNAAANIQDVEMLNRRSINTIEKVRVDIEIGLILHFLKRRTHGTWSDNPTASGKDLLGCPGKAGLQGVQPRYSTLAKEYSEQTDVTCWMLTSFPLSLQWLRAIDVAADEMSVPTWVIAPSFNRIRRSSDVASLLLKKQFGVDVPRIRSTAHAGEDFTHLLTGLRSIDEAIDLFDLSERDRIGHGLALGMDAKEWVLSTGPVAISKHDRLFDLVWEWSIVERGSINSLSSRIHYVEQEILKISREIFGDACPGVFELATLRTQLNNPTNLFKIGYPGPVRHVTKSLMQQQHRSSDSILRYYLTDEEVFLRGEELIWVDSSGFEDALTSIQSIIKRKVARKGIVLEVNPTSNLLIGDLGNLARHPLWDLSSPLRDETNNHISICIGSDDPAVFATDLRQEYQRLMDAAVFAGYSEEDARVWVDRVRFRGLETRFTLSHVIPLSVRDFSVV